MKNIGKELVPPPSYSTYSLATHISSLLGVGREYQVNVFQFTRRYDGSTQTDVEGLVASGKGIANHLEWAAALRWQEAKLRRWC